MKTTLKQHQVKTSKTRKGPTPLMPHERDESDEPAEVQQRDDIKQAYEDLQQGMVDTDLRDIGGVDEVVNDRPGNSPDKVVKKSF
ncbi:MAG TPA: hypothetical protein VF450_04440 [Noviherbaspirillum sp.]